MSGEPPYKWGMGNPLGTNTIDDGWSQYTEQPAFKLKNDSPDQRELSNQNHQRIEEPALRYDMTKWLGWMVLAVVIVIPAWLWFLLWLIIR